MPQRHQSPESGKPPEADVPDPEACTRRLCLSRVRVGAPLGAQWLRLHAPSAGGRGRPLVGELDLIATAERSHVQQSRYFLKPKT